jgi:LPXTG-motif cell wall-anchored protein
MKGNLIMRTFKKLLSLFTALLMSIGMGITPIMAQDGTNSDSTTKGTITISNPTKGETYSLYRLFNATTTGLKDTSSATNSNSNVVGGGALGGDSTTPVDTSKLDDTGISYTATEDQKDFFTTQDNNPFTFTARTSTTDDPNPYYVTVTEGTSDADVIKFLSSLMEVVYEKDENGTEKKDAEGNKIYETNNFPAVFELVGNPQTLTKNSNATSLQFTNLDPGYYFINSSLGAVVTITSAQPNATVIDKNQGPYVPTPSNKTDEDVDSFKTIAAIRDANGNPKSDLNSIAVGDIITYKLTLNVTNFVGDKAVTFYSFVDKLGAGLEYVTKTYEIGGLFPQTETLPKTVVTLKDSNGTETLAWQTDFSLLDGAVYYGDNKTTGDTTSSETDTNVYNQAFTMNFQWGTSAENMFHDLAGGTGVLTIEYEARVLSTANKDNIANKAEWFYQTTDPQDGTVPGGKDEKTPELYGVSIYSFYENNGTETPLANATYTLTKLATASSSETEGEGTESTGTESTGTESTGTEGTGTEGTGTEGAGTEGTGTEGTGTEGTGTEGTGTEGTGTEGTETETPSEEENAPLAFIQVGANSNVYRPFMTGDDVNKKVTELRSDDTGYIYIIGLDKAKYAITETQAPNGYTGLQQPAESDPDKMNSYEINLTSSYEFPADGETSTAYTTNLLKVKHTTGKALPSTGGIGTTIFYVAGSLLVIGAVVFLITNRKMKTAN